MISLDRQRQSAASAKPGPDASLGVLAVCGISHQSAALAEREPFQVGRGELTAALEELKSVRGVREGMILSTCNRFEAYLVLDAGEEPFNAVRDFFVRFKGVDPKPRRSLFYVRHGSTAARHLFRVAAGLDSLVLGEYQIQGQIKEAYSAACSVKAPGKLLHRLVHAAFRAGKAVRSQTQVGAGRLSVAGMAEAVLREQAAPGEPVLLIGANENIRIIAEGLEAAGYRRLIFANRTLFKAEKLAARFKGEGHGLDRLGELLASAACAVSCTGAPGFVIPSALLLALARKGSCPRLLVDLAMPRDIERPSKDTTFSAAVIDLEDLKELREGRLDIRKEEIPAAVRIIEDSVAVFQSWLDGAFEPGMGALIKEYERIREGCLEEAKSAFKPEDREALERFSRDLLRALLKVPAKTILENPPPPPSHNS